MGLLGLRVAVCKILLDFCLLCTIMDYESYVFKDIDAATTMF